MEPFDLVFTNSKYRIIWHVTFWLLVLVYYTFYFGHQGGYYWFTFQFVVFMMPITIGTTYLFNYYLIPRFLFPKRIFRFVLYSIYTVILSFYLITMTIFPFLITITNNVNFVTLDKSFLDIYFLIVGIYTAILLAILIKLVKYSYERQHLSLQLLKDKTSAELEMLKSQINPHFLFNTLNNIYTLSLKKSKQTHELVLKLSGMLDYLLYECNASLVSLNKEILLIENYIYLQLVRFSSRLDIQFVKEGEISDQQIAPMLLLPFVENSFKHGVGKQRNKAWINIKLIAQESQLEFQVRNSLSVSKTLTERPASGGIGLVNVGKRLNLIYPKKHSLTAGRQDDAYYVIFKLNIAI